MSMGCKVCAFRTAIQHLQSEKGQAAHLLPRFYQAWKVSVSNG